jgi:hypothetical protein
MPYELQIYYDKIPSSDHIRGWLCIFYNYT